MNRYIWLIGENLGNTANNNSYYFWLSSMENDDDIDKYYVFCDNRKNRKIYKSLPAKYKKNIVWRNTVRHLKLYVNADMFFVSESYRDVRPERILGRDLDLSTEKPLIYLQHGTLGIKALGYQGNSYNNNFFRFVYYNKQIAPIFEEYNNFKPYQMYYGEYQPRYIELVRRYKEYKSEKKKILWFLTWREYMGENIPTKILLRKIQKTVTDPNLLEYLDKTDTDLVMCVHKFFDDEKIEMIMGDCKTDHVMFVQASQTDVMQELVSCDLLITDYSSVGFDVTLIDKPVILFQPDIEAYLSKRDLYCEIDELNGNRRNSICNKIACRSIDGKRLSCTVVVLEKKSEAKTNAICTKPLSAL